MAHTLNAEIADRVRVAMQERGLSITSLASETGIAERTLKRRLGGNSDWLTGELERIAKATTGPEMTVGDRIKHLLGATRAT